MDTINQTLSQLKDIHEPPPIGLWPLAPGWYCLLILVILIFFLITKQIKASKKHRIRNQGLKVLNKLNHTDEIKLISELSILLRKLNKAKYGTASASLTGRHWLEHLDKTGNTNAFTKGVGCVLVDAPYQQKHTIDCNALKHVIREWIQKQ